MVGSEAQEHENLPRCGAALGPASRFAQKGCVKAQAESQILLAQICSSHLPLSTEAGARLAAEQNLPKLHLMGFCGPSMPAGTPCLTGGTAFPKVCLRKTPHFQVSPSVKETRDDVHAVPENALETVKLNKMCGIFVLFMKRSLLKKRS